MLRYFFHHMMHAVHVAVQILQTPNRSMCSSAQSATLTQTDSQILAVACRIRRILSGEIVVVPSAQVWGLYLSLCQVWFC